MGIFDRLIKDVTKKAVGEAIDSAFGTNHSSQPASQPAYNPAPAATPAVPEEDNRTIEQKLDAILASSFSSYQVQKKVDPRSMGAVGASLIPFDYVISQGGQIRLIVMTPGKNTCGTRGYRFTKEFAQQSGLTLINFLQDSLNEESYITDRLHQYI
ncbi:MAG: hypothetical protein J5752_04110 [Clostridiales bacterium]|nr:hypothetical protein [Clostridiales bacterium]